MGYKKTFDRTVNGVIIKGFEGVKISLFRDVNNQYISLVPNCYVENISQYDRNALSAFNKMFDLHVNNKKPNYFYNQYTESWYKKLIGNKLKKCNFPDKRYDNFVFKFGCNPLYVGLDSYKIHSSIVPNQLSLKQIAIKGKEYKDPDLRFYNPITKKYSDFFHPMKGLIDNQPFDYISSTNYTKPSIDIAVVTPEGFNEDLLDFLNSCKESSKIVHFSPESRPLFY